MITDRLFIVFEEGYAAVAVEQDLRISLEGGGEMVDSGRLEKVIAGFERTIWKMAFPFDRPENRRRVMQIIDGPSFF